MDEDKKHSLSEEEKKADERLKKRQEERRLRKKQEREKQQKRNRIIMVVIALLVLLFIIFGISSCVSSCVKNSTANAQANNAGAESPTQTATAVAVPSDAQTATQPVSTNDIQDNGEDGYVTDSGIYIWNNQAFEMFYGDESMAQTYASAISYYRQQLDSSINVYNMVVPTHIAFGLPDRLENSVDSKNQADYLNAVYNSYSTDVKGVNIFNALEQHKTEYIFFNTDHHWTSLGAYYAYQEFCLTAGEAPVDINTITPYDIPGFVGSLYTATNAEVLNNNPDTVRYYDMPETYTMNLLQQDATEYMTLDSMYYSGSTAGSETYGVFIWGDNPVTKIVNTQPKNSRKLLVVKESFGNAIVPWFINNYNEVHAIDFRYYEGNLSSYCTENGITDVLFINGVMSSANSFQLDSMSSLFA